MRHGDFLAGKLFSADIHRVYTRLSLPVSVSHGARGNFTDFHMLNLVSDKANWHCSVYPTGAMCYFELPDRFFADYDRWQQRTVGSRTLAQFQRQVHNASTRHSPA